MRTTIGKRSWAVVMIAVAASAGFAAGVAWRGGLSGGGSLLAPSAAGGPAARSPNAPFGSTAPSSAEAQQSPGASGPAGVGIGPSPSGSGPGPVVGPSPSVPAAVGFVAPPLTAPLTMLDPGLLKRESRSSGDWLFESSTKPPLVVTHPTGIGADWRLVRPDQAAVRGYAGDVSVAPGNAISLHLAGRDRQARLDVFRMGLGDARHVMTVRGVAISARADAAPDLMTGRIEDQWPVSYSLSVGSTWRPGVYLVKLTGESGGQSYVIFLVRSPAPTALMVVLPLMTYEAYNDQGGASLYRWDGGPHARGFEVSFNRPFASQFGAGQFFWLDFPLVVWLEDHGYNPGYLTDLDIARNPRLVERAATLLFAGHGEYWTGGIRDVVATRAAHGTNLGFFGANQAFWQVRLESDGLGTRDRTIVCYKDAALDPASAVNPAAATTRFDDPAVGRSPSGIIGTEYGGIVHGMAPVVMGPGISIFAPDIGLAPGQLLPGILAGEIDSAPESFNGGLLGASPSTVGTNSEAVTAAMAVWINPSGGRVFDAGTLGFSWGLDPRYAASLAGFPATAFDALTARILAWLGAQPDPAVVSAVSARVSYESVAGRFATAALATRYVKRLARKHSVGYVVEHEPGRGHKPFHVVRQFPARKAAASAVRRLRKMHLPASIEADHGLGP